MDMYIIQFVYRDSLSAWKWKDQICKVCAANELEARKKCIEWYGLNQGDVDYKIIKIVKG